VDRFIGLRGAQDFTEDEAPAPGSVVARSDPAQIKFDVAQCPDFRVI